MQFLSGSQEFLMNTFSDQPSAFSKTLEKQLIKLTVEI